MTSTFFLCMDHQITQLHFGLQHYHCAILTGPSGSSKTTCLRTLAAAYHHLGEVRALRRHIPEGEKGYPSSVNIVVINPAAHTEEEVGIRCVVECIQDVQVCVCTHYYSGLSHSHTCTQLFGSYKMNAGITHWQDGILTRLLRQIESNAGLKQSLNHPTYSSPLHNSQVRTNLIYLQMLFLLHFVHIATFMIFAVRMIGQHLIW